MLKSAVLCLAVIATAATAAQAGGRQGRAYLPPSSSAGTVNNYYGPTTVYQGAAPAYRTDSAYPAYAPSAGYGGAYGGAYADSYYYGSYGAPWGQPFAGGVGYAPYGYGGYGPVTAPVYSGARMDPWNGYNGAPGNGYW